MRQENEPKSTRQILKDVYFSSERRKLPQSTGIRRVAGVVWHLLPKTIRWGILTRTGMIDQLENLYRAQQGMDIPTAHKLPSFDEFAEAMRQREIRQKEGPNSESTIIQFPRPKD